METDVTVTVGSRPCVLVRSAAHALRCRLTRAQLADGAALDALAAAPQIWVNGSGFGVSAVLVDFAFAVERVEGHGERPCSQLLLLNFSICLLFIVAVPQYQCILGCVFL